MELLSRAGAINSTWLQFQEGDPVWSRRRTCTGTRGVYTLQLSSFAQRASWGTPSHQPPVPSRKPEQEAAERKGVGIIIIIGDHWFRGAFPFPGSVNRMFLELAGIWPDLQR